MVYPTLVFALWGLINLNLPPIALQMRGHIHTLVQDTDHLYPVAGLAPEKYYVRTNQVLAIACAYVLCALPDRAGTCQVFCQRFTCRMNRQHIGIGLIRSPVAVAVVPNIRKIRQRKR